MKIIFVTGGARSGKSGFALNMADAVSVKKAYIATAESMDSEMSERIKKHKEARGKEWDTFEEPVKISALIKSLDEKYDVLLIDCLTLWLSNMMLADKNVEEEMKVFCSSLLKVRCSLIIVSNEVGMGIVPENKLARQFRDLSGMLNQKIAEISDEVYLLTAGIPIKIK